MRSWNRLSLQESARWTGVQLALVTRLQPEGAPDCASELLRLMKLQAEQALALFLGCIGYDVGYSDPDEASPADEIGHDVGYSDPDEASPADEIGHDVGYSDPDAASLADEIGHDVGYSDPDAASLADEIGYDVSYSDHHEAWPVDEMNHDVGYAEHHEASLVDEIGHDVGYAEHQEASLADERRERAEMESQMSDEIRNLRDQVATLNEQLASLRLLAPEQTAVTAASLPPGRCDQPDLEDATISAARAVLDDPNGSVFSFAMTAARPAALENSSTEVANTPVQDKAPDQSLTSNQQALSDETSASVDGTTTGEEPAESIEPRFSMEPVSLEKDEPALTTIPILNSPREPNTASTTEDSSSPDVTDHLSAFPPETPALGWRPRASLVR